MGKGVALQFKEAFPHNYIHYQAACTDKSLRIGTPLAVKDTNLLLGECLIINFPTKTDWRLPSQYDYIEQSLIALASLIAKDQLKNIAVPALGCGNGGLNWKQVRPLVIKYLSPLDAIIEIYEPAY